MHIEFQQTNELWTVLDNVTISYPGNTTNSPGNSTITHGNETTTAQTAVVISQPDPTASEQESDGITHKNKVIAIVVASVGGAVLLLTVAALILHFKIRQQHKAALYSISEPPKLVSIEHE
jgi:hypothetical protein